MPNKKSAIKRVRQNEKRRTRNRAKRSEMRSAIKTVRRITVSGELEGADEALQNAQSKLGKAAKTHLLRKQTAARYVSRLTKAVAKARAEKASA